MAEPPSDSRQTKFSMLEAARQIGVSQSTMHRYIKAGKVSTKKLDTGGYEIDASELFRAFPPGWHKKGSQNAAETGHRDDTEPHGGTPVDAGGEAGALRAEVKMLREMLERVDLDNERERRALTDTIDDLRSRLDRTEEERRGLSVQLLTYTKPTESVTPPTRPSKRGFLGFFKRAG